MPKVNDIMTADPVQMAASSTMGDAAREMAQNDIGDVLVLDDERLCGIVTDRDLVVRGLAEGRDPATTLLGELCTKDLETVSPNDDAGDVIRRMRDAAVRRMPVVDGDNLIGIVSIGDLAVEFDADSLLGQISEAPAD